MKPKVITLTDDEDNRYGKLISRYMNSGMSVLKAEQQTIEDLKQEFPRLKKLFKGNYKIAP